MLVLSRKIDESIVIGKGNNRVRVLVVDIRDHGSKVRLGIECDASIPVHREEVAAAIEAAESQDEFPRGSAGGDEAPESE